MNLNQAINEAQKAHQAGKFEEAEKKYHDLLREFPSFAEGWHFLGLLYSQAGDFRRGAEMIRKALELAPGDPAALNNLGEACNRAGDTEAAVAALQEAITVDPQMPEAYFNLANIYKQMNQFDSAVTHYRSAIRLRPGYVEAWFNLGNACLARGLFRSAADAFEKAVSLNPDHAEARLNLGTAYLELGETQKAVNRYRDVVAAQPDEAIAFLALGQALEKQGDIPGAIAGYNRALALEPGNDSLRLHVETLCPPVLGSQAALDQYRNRLKHTLESYRNKPFAPGTPSNGEAFFPSLVTYQGGNDLSLKLQWSELFRAHFEDLRPDPGPGRRPAGGKLRVGFVVTHGHEGVFLKCMRGIINRLPDRGNFEVTVVCSVQGGPEILRRGIVHPDVNFLALPSDLDKAADTLREAGFDLLHYWEVGTDALNYFLPFHRAAPVQCATWGWPVTTGIRQIDYFLSCELLETESSDAVYSESLVRFERLPTYYHVPPVPEAARPRASFGLGARDHLYLCTQNLRKVHPDMDRLFMGILEADEQARVLLIQDAQPGVTDLLRRRFRSEIPGVADRIQFLPRMPEADYLNVVQLADVILDTVHYCGGANTTYDAFAAGAPVVTLPMRYHRGRYTAAAYRQIGFTDLVASSARDYVRLALALGTDRKMRDEMGSHIREVSSALFEDDLAVDELARFLESAVAL